MDGSFERVVIKYISIGYSRTRTAQKKTGSKFGMFKMSEPKFKSLIYINSFNRKLEPSNSRFAHNFRYLYTGRKRVRQPKLTIFET